MKLNWLKCNAIKVPVVGDRSTDRFSIQSICICNDLLLQIITTLTFLMYEVCVCVFVCMMGILYSFLFQVKIPTRLGITQPTMGHQVCGSPLGDLLLVLVRNPVYLPPWWTISYQRPLAGLAQPIRRAKGPFLPGAPGSSATSPICCWVQLFQAAQGKGTQGPAPLLPVLTKPVGIFRSLALITKSCFFSFAFFFRHVWS